MSNFEKFMSSWEETLNTDAELQERNKSPYSTIEGRTAVQLEIGKFSPYMVDVKDGRFSVKKGTAKQPLLCWMIPTAAFKDLLLGKHQLMYSILDPQGELSFDTPNFTHWNGATIIEVLFLAHEMTVKSPKIFKLVEELEY